MYRRMHVLDAGVMTVERTSAPPSRHELDLQESLERIPPGTWTYDLCKRSIKVPECATYYYINISREIGAHDTHL